MDGGKEDTAPSRACMPGRQRTRRMHSRCTVRRGPARHTVNAGNQLNTSGSGEAIMEDDFDVKVRGELGNNLGERELVIE